MGEGQSSSTWLSVSTFIVAVLTVAVAIAGLAFVFSPIFDLGLFGKPPDDKVSFYITGVGVPLLTFAGFLAVFLGFLGQRRQNELQKEQLDKQQENFQKDRFESTFFQLLRTQNQIVEDIQVERKRETTEGDMFPKLKTFREGQKDVETIIISGRSCLQLFYSEMSHIFEIKKEEEGWRESESGEEPKIRWVYEIWFSERKPELNHYFSHLSKLISFVHRSDFGNKESDFKDKEFYIGLITAQMSLPEQKLFFYHANLKKDESEHWHLDEIYELLAKYTFFKQVGFKSLIHKQHYQLNKGALGVD